MQSVKKSDQCLVGPVLERGVDTGWRYAWRSDKVYAVFNAVFNSVAGKEIVNNITCETWHWSGIDCVSVSRNMLVEKGSGAWTIATRRLDAIAAMIVVLPLRGLY